MRAWDDYRAQDAFMGYAEIPLLSTLIKRHWGQVFGLFFETTLPKSGFPKRTKGSVVEALTEAIDFRNALMHTKWALNDQEMEALRQLAADVDNWLTLLEQSRDLSSEP